MEDWRDKLGTLLPNNYVPETEDTKAIEGKNGNIRQTLRVELDKRKGKPATIISGFEGSEEELKELAKTLKVKCSAGGSQRDGEILIQGDFRIKAAEILQNMGFKVKKNNFK